jgi:AcrR family transcriptional regulator
MPATRRTYRGKNALERTDDRRRRLLDAGLEVFGTVGYPASTIPAICAEAGVSSSHFYESFESREALLRGVYDAIVAEVTAGEIDALTVADHDLATHIRRGLAAFVTPFADERKARVNFIEIVGASRELERHRRSVLRGFASIIEREANRYAERGLIPTRERPVVAMALVGATQEPLVDWFSQPPSGRRPLDDVLEDLLHIYLAVLNQPARPESDDEVACATVQPRPP